MSYIVKNCPAITEYKFPDKVHKDCCQCTYGYCKDINCLIKQVIDKCREETKLIRIYEDRDKGTAIAEYSLSKDFAQAILNIFDIEEINK